MSEILISFWSTRKSKKTKLRLNPTNTNSSENTISFGSKICVLSQPWYIWCTFYSWEKSGTSVSSISSSSSSLYFSTIFWSGSCVSMYLSLTPRSTMWNFKTNGTSKKDHANERGSYRTRRNTFDTVNYIYTYRIFVISVPLEKAF